MWHLHGIFIEVGCCLALSPRSCDVV